MKNFGKYYITEWEANGRDDSDGDVIVYNANTKSLEHNFWTTRGYCPCTYNAFETDTLEDGYDAGWLAPNGDFYGADGPTSSFIHLNIADKIYDLLYKDMSRYDSVFKVLRDTDEMLCNMGWMKIHHSDCYGYFAHSKKDDKYYNPTKQQIDAICKYGNKFYNGKISTAPMTSRTTKCSDILQMDEIALHKEFTRL